MNGRGQRDLTKGNIAGTLLMFSVPMILGNFMQQIYNLVDTWVVGKYIGPEALAAVGSAYTLMTFLNSVIIGLCMGGGAVASYYFGQGRTEEMERRVQLAFVLIGTVTVLLNFAAFAWLDGILKLLNTPSEIYGLMRGYVQCIFFGMVFTFLYNFFAFVLRAQGNSVIPLFVLAFSALLNIVLDIWFVLGLHWSVEGAAAATVVAQACSGIILMFYTGFRLRIHFLPKKGCFVKTAVKETGRLCLTAAVQQSVMNFGILMIQGLVNSFGTLVMAAFAAAVKIDTLAYMPAQEFSNAYSLFISQNYGAGNQERVRLGTRIALRLSIMCCVAVSVIVIVFAEPLLRIFIDGGSTKIIETGAGYLRVEGSFYFAIGILFLLYGYYRGINRPGFSLVLTVISLGTRVVLAYLFSPVPWIGVWAIWAAIPIGWLLADAVGFIFMRKRKEPL